ncbi:MAG: McrB family protein [Candidatus Scalindua sp.]
MAKRREDESLYILLNKFIDKCLIAKDSIFDETTGIFTTNNINTCIEKFVDNFKDDKRNFTDKIEEQFKGTSDNVKLVFAHANWLWAFSVNDMTAKGKETAVKNCLPEKFKINDKCDGLELFPENGFGSAGTYHKQNKYCEIVFILKLFKGITNSSLTSVEEIKTYIEKVSLFAKYDEAENPTEAWQQDIRKIDKSCAMFNILLYICKPEKYERIASNNHKNQIVNSFISLIRDEINNENIDEKIQKIREKITTHKNDFDFYDENIANLWNPWISDSEYNEIQGLSFKKNIILYGPPGTGKTYTAKALANSFIAQKVIQNDKSRVKDYIEGKINTDNRIRRLQLHSNYSYEDFIAGIQLKDGKTVPVKGYFYRLCEEVTQDTDKSPYILILDEINRIDLSRMFGEAFSAIENRDDEIDLPVGDFKLKIPDNLYLIGTMNEIDFSLERLDFALRRRFVWFFYGFNVDTLRMMIEENTTKFNKVPHNDINTFIENAAKLNEKISGFEELGKQFQIGHTFFAEIIDVAKQFYGRERYFNKVPLFKANGPVETLWNISIEPMLHAFFGNFDETQKNEHLSEMKEILFDGKK